MPARTQNLSQFVLTIPLLCQQGHKYKSHHMLIKPLPCQRGHKKNINTCCENPTNASVDRKYISTCFDQMPPMPPTTQNAPQHLLTKPLPCHRGKKCISKWVDQTYPMRARIQKVYQLALTKLLQYQRRHKIHLNMY